MQTVLIIDDNEGVRTALKLLFSIHDIRALASASPDEGLAIIDSRPVDLVIQDMNFSGDTTSGDEGIALFHEIRNRQPNLPVILLTAWSHLETAVELVKAGAADYLSKPWDDDKLLATSRNLLQLSAVQHEKDAMAESRRRARLELAQSFDLCGTIFESDAMQYVIGTATQIAKSDVSVLITGPNRGYSLENLEKEVLQVESQRLDFEHITPESVDLLYNLFRQVSAVDSDHKHLVVFIDRMNSRDPLERRGHAHPQL